MPPYITKGSRTGLEQSVMHSPCMSGCLPTGPRVSYTGTSWNLNGRGSPSRRLDPMSNFFLSSLSRGKGTRLKNAASCRKYNSFFLIAGCIGSLGYWQSLTSLNEIRHSNSSDSALIKFRTSNCDSVEREI